MSSLFDLPPYPSDDEAATIADWIEMRVLGAETPFTRGQLLTTGARDNTPITVAEGAWDALAERCALAGNLWPFVINQDVVEIRASSLDLRTKLYYSFFCALALRYNIDNAAREMFEHVVAHLLRAFVGGAAIRIGFPRRPPVPTPINDAVALYCSQSRELFHSKLPATDGDLGLDVACWSDFQDARGGALHFIGQCATGADWPDKLRELNPDKWGDHVSWAVQPVRFFSVPFVLAKAEVRRASKDGGLMFDRLRLISLVARAPTDQALEAQIQAFLQKLYVN